MSPSAEPSRPRRGPRGFLLAAVGGALALGVLSWRFGARDSEAPTAAARFGTLLQTVDVEGEIAAVGSLDLGPPVVPDMWNYKIAFLADEGTSVENGQPVIRFDPTPLQRQLDEKQAEFEEASQKIARGRLESGDKGRDLDLQLTEARSRLQKAQTKDEIPVDLRSRIEARQAALELTLAQKEVTSLEERRKSVGTAETASLRSLISQRDRALGRVTALREAIDKMTVRAPQDGIVIYKTGWRNEKRKIGDTIWWGERLISLPDLTKLQGDGEVDEADGGAIAAGQHVTLRLEALPNRDFDAKVSRIGSTVRRKSPRVPSKVFSVELAFAKPDPALRPAMRFRGEIEIARVARVLLIPREAVFFRSAGPIAYVRGWRGFKPVPLKLGRTGRANVEVLSGLSESDVVALSEPEGKA